MLSSLFGSEIRAKIFKLFFSDPEKVFGLSEAAKILEAKAISLEKELDCLAKEGILSVEISKPDNGVKTLKPIKMSVSAKNKTKPVSGVKSYQALTSSIFFPEIRSIISKEKILSIKDAFSSIKENFNPRLMFLTGKFVGSSDLPTDIMIVGNVPHRQLVLAVSDLEKVIGYEINFTLMSEREFEYRREVMDVFLYNVLEGDKIMISGSLESTLL